mgnify:CR=1 FL=1
MRAKICLVTPGHPSKNPRLVKEADALVESGYEVSVVAGDYHPWGHDADEQYVKVRHRPDMETPIKNKGDGERLVALSDDICELLDDWLDNKRPDVTDDHGREPLLKSNSDCIVETTIQRYV